MNFVDRPSYSRRAGSANRTIVIWIAVALHVIPITVVVLFLTGVLKFHRSPPPEPDQTPEISIVTTRPNDPPRPPAQPPPAAGAGAGKGVAAPIPPRRPAEPIANITPPRVPAPPTVIRPSESATRPMPRTPTQVPKWTATGGPAELRTLAVAGSGRCVVGGTDKTVHVFDADGKESHTFAGMTGPENNVAISRDGGTILVGGNTPTQIGRIHIAADCLLRAVSLRSGKPVTVGIHLTFISCLALSSNGRYALTGSDRVVRYWDVNGAREIRHGGFLGHTARVNAVDFHPKTFQAVSIAADDTARIWDLNTGKSLRVIEGLPGSPRGVAYSPDGRAILIWGPGVLGSWDAVTGVPILTVTAAAARRVPRLGSAGAAAWTPDGNIVISSTEGVALIDASSGTVLREFAGAPPLVNAVGVSGDGRFVIAAGRGIAAWELDKSAGQP